MRPAISLTIIIPLLLAILAQPSSEAQSSDEISITGLFLSLLRTDPQSNDLVLEYLDETWEEHYAIMAVEIAYFSRDPNVFRKLIRLLNNKTGQNLGTDLDAWYSFIWSQDPKIHPDTYAFKANLYRLVDPRFETYFKDRNNATIRLDEIRWGGVVQDGIPPLRNPEMLEASAATYLQDDHVVFGISINGDARAYPKRILAWHEMFVDEVGGKKVAGVYCTLCGTVIIYDTVHNGVEHHLGTSGFLYRSNKLMYDKDTQSLWNTVWGKPVLGPLVGENIELEQLSVVTTTWGEWKQRHPETTVLSLNTGHQRDYGEGIAYQDYFATDELMFHTPFKDDRLKNKESVLALNFAEANGQALAIATEFLNANPVYQDDLGPISFVVFTDPSGANRIYEDQGNRFTSFDGAATAEDAAGGSWTIFESHLSGPEGQRLERLPQRNAFWFGWLAAYPDTRLVH